MAKGKFHKSQVSATDNYVFPGQITIESFIDLDDEGIEY